MSQEHAGDTVSAAIGALTVIVWRLITAVDWAHFSTQAITALLLGMIGGIGGILVRRVYDRKNNNTNL